jgi:tetratricopeptide (TPR) repeat protein
LSWINKAIELDKDPKFWVYRQKSLIQADLGDYKNAVATAKKALELAEKAGNADHVKLNKDSIEEWAN